MHVETKHAAETGATVSPSRQRALIAVTIFFIPFLYFSPALTGQVTLVPGDGWMQNFPLRALAGQMIAHGELPLWNPFIYGGMPLAASVYPGVFYPPNWLFAILPAQWAMNLVVLTTYHIALIGAYLYARRIGMARAGALLAGIAFTFGGFMINHLSHTSRIAAAAWLPWVLLSIEELARNASRRRVWWWAALGSIFIALQFLAGEPQMLIFTALVSVPCAISALFKCKGPVDRLRFVMSIAVMLVCGALLSMIQLLPTLELLAQSERNNPGAAFFDTYSFPPWQLPGLIIPYFFGGASLPPYRVTYWGAETATIMAGYVGMLSWILALVAVFAAGRNGRVWIWTSVAIISIILAFGGYLPFGINHALYRIPGYGTFRGLYRHQLEFTFALAMLAGLGLNRLMDPDRRASRRALWRGTIAMSVLIIVAVILYRFFGDALATVKPRPPQAASLANAELLVPLFCFALSLAALWFFQTFNLRTQTSSFILAALLLIDVASYGYFFQWRKMSFDVGRRLADPPAVQFIKSREKEFSSFRVMSHPVQPYDYLSDWPEDPNFELINQPNISLLRGLQSLSGYDILRPTRVGEMTGTAGLATQGLIQDSNSFQITDRGFDLLNLKYLIVGYGGATSKKTGYTYEGIDFPLSYFGTEFKPGVNFTTEPPSATATEIAIISSVANSAHLPDGAPVLKLRLHTKDARVIERELQTGRDTSEWSYDCSGGQGQIKHRRATVVQRNPAGKCDALLYLGRLKFDRAEIEKIEWIYAREDALLYLVYASLHDETTGRSTPLNSFHLPSERWRKLARFDQIEVYENLNALPRAWFVEKRLEMPSAAVIKTIRSGILPTGEKFDPATTALLEKGDRETTAAPVTSAPFTSPAAREQEIKIIDYRPHRIALETRRSEGGFLVLSEVYDDGWKAYLDGEERQVLRTDYTLRGIDVPSGQHRIEFVYRPRSFRNGAICSAVGFIFMILFAAIGIRRAQPETGELES